MDLTITLSAEEVGLLLEALDSHEYWQLGRDLPRKDGVVFIPGDFLGGEDPLWTEGVEADPTVIAAVESCRRLADRLSYAKVSPAEA
jgi:hypothetical protein